MAFLNPDFRHRSARWRRWMAGSGGSRLDPGSHAPSAGSINQKTAPCGLFGATHTRPSCASIIERQIDRPIPIPPDFVVKNGSNIRSMLCEPIPVPVSATDFGRRHIPSAVARLRWRSRRHGTRRAMRALRWHAAFRLLSAQAAGPALPARTRARPTLQLLLCGRRLPVAGDAAIAALSRPQGLSRRDGPCITLGLVLRETAGRISYRDRHGTPKYSANVGPRAH